MAKDKDATTPPAVTEEKFFMAIIGRLDGKIDWKKVANECSIVSPAAAQKRFSRLKAKHGQLGTASSKKASTPVVESDDPEEKPKKKKAPRKTTNKKRKVEVTEAEDGEEEMPVKGEDGEA
ncbi:hypothetical protein LTR78_003759 [Recurvomyces mirabilis]|uniref:Myb-like DNA-binding domain-containing protein n=1 Tax=Recurvomyces mirabilis TaxID=574656 RepID=A0AAE1C3K1_9PEZI|nr:hypothetical protein LTR78_003759 [Recurvomyces mirabilis]KAK5154871.1 hypothetical protein LTS14_006452 [Recurvomyces mirabilis]